MSVADMQTQSWSVMQLNSEESNSNSFTLPSETEFDTTDANYVNIFNSSQNFSIIYFSHAVLSFSIT